MATRRNFQFVEGSSSKFWEVWQEGAKVMTRYGRIGAEGQTTVKDEGSAAAATKLHDKLVSEKVKKGYVEAKQGVPAKSVSKSPGKKQKLTLKQLPTVWHLSTGSGVTGLVVDAQHVRMSDTSANVLKLDHDGAFQSRGAVANDSDGQSVPSIIGDGRAVYAVTNFSESSSQGPQAIISDISGAKPRTLFKVDREVSEAAMIPGAFALLAHDDTEDTLAVYDARGAKRWSVSADDRYPSLRHLIAASAQGVFCDAMKHGEDACVLGFDWEGKRRFQVKTKSRIAGLGATVDGCVALTEKGELLVIGADGRVQTRLFCPPKHKRIQGGAACAASPDGTRIYAAANGWLFCFDPTGNLLFEAPVLNPTGIPQFTTLRAFDDVLFGILERTACQRIDVSAEGLALAAAGKIKPIALSMP